MDQVVFITSEDGDDLIVSFVVPDRDLPSEIQSLILMRTPRYEAFLDEAERGVSFSDERWDDDRSELLRELCVDSEAITIRTDRAQYELDISKVDPAELAEASRVLEKMNVDRRFRLLIA